ncbi:hypothetical protein LUZ60_014677 [Juncus effusus]|nr:hypothetical protein LUZ60_014677 [Juncus effusus]
MESSEEYLAQASSLIPLALNKSTGSSSFPSRWKSIRSKMERIPSCLSDLSSHPCFSKNTLCKELLQSIICTLSEAICLADTCQSDSSLKLGKLQMQSDLDSLSGKLDLNLRDCALLIKTGVLSDSSGPVSVPVQSVPVQNSSNISELLARLQIGHAESKHKAIDNLLEALREDEKSVLSSISRTNISALVQLLTATSAKVREKTASIICSLAESGNLENLLLSEGILPPLIRLAESGGLIGREKAVITLQRLSMSADTCRALVGHGGVRPLIEICQTGDSVSQSAAAGTLKNVSVVPEVRQTLAEEGIVKVMINLMDCGMVLGSKEYSAECLQNLTSTNDNLRRLVISEGGLRSILNYIDGPLPQESAVGALKNLVNLVSTESLVSLGFLPRIVHVLKNGSPGAQQMGASAICKVSNSPEMKKIIGEFGIIPLLINLLEAKTTGIREVAAQALASLMSCHMNVREVKRDEKAVPNLVQLLDPNLGNTAKKYAVVCLAGISRSRKCRKLMVSHGAIGYLKKLSEMEVGGAKKLLERLQRGKFRGLFGRK